MKKTLAAALTVAFLSSQPIAAQELHVCPKGAVGEWEWSATAERTKIYYKKGTWNLGPDVDLPQNQKPEVQLTEIAENGKDPRAYVNIRFYPAGLNDPLKGAAHPLFSTMQHNYGIGIAPQGGDIEINVMADWRALSRYSLGLFGSGGTVDAADGSDVLKALIKKPGMSGLFVFPPENEGISKDPIAFLVLSEDGRAGAWKAAAAAHNALAAKVPKGPGCKLS